VVNWTDITVLKDLIEITRFHKLTVAFPSRQVKRLYRHYLVGMRLWFSLYTTPDGYASITQLHELRVASNS
jgi:hypothetical protein